MKKGLLAFLLMIVMTGCKQTNKQTAHSVGNTQDTATVNLQYAKGSEREKQMWNQ